MTTPSRIVLAGNPNCGKTSLFNALTGLRYKVANYPGVTVEKKEGRLRGIDNVDALVVDLPGVYSLSGNSPDEQIACKLLLGQLTNEERPDLIISVVDSCNLERNLYLTSQLIDLGIPVILALNMFDLAAKRGISIKKEILSQALGIPVIPISAFKEWGVDELGKQVKKILTSGYELSTSRFAWLPVESEYAAAIAKIGELEKRGNSLISELDQTLVGSLILSETISAASPQTLEELQTIRTQLAASGNDPASLEATYRYQWINKIIKRCWVTKKQDGSGFTEKLDAILVHKFWGTLIFCGVMTLIFQSIFWWAELPMELIDALISLVGGVVGKALPEGMLRSLVVDGIIAGVGSVLIFIPQIALLFIFLGILEETGYLARAAFLMDRVMRQFGLQGRSFIPLLSSFACAIPGIMATRTIPAFADRLVTILIAPLMSCSARLPVYTLLIAAFIPEENLFGVFSLKGLMLLGMYLLGIIAALVVALILKSWLLRGSPALFVMELPPMRLPSLKVVIRDTVDRVMLFIKDAGTIILACAIVLWFLASFPQGDIKDSLAGRIGRAMEPVIQPLGYNWEIGVGILASFAAREVFVTSLATVYNLQDSDDTTQSIVATLQSRQRSGTFTLASALSLMVFYVFACQCMSTVAICRRETGSWGWTAFMFLYMSGLAYFGALLTYSIFA